MALRRTREKGPDDKSGPGFTRFLQTTDSNGDWLPASEVVHANVAETSYYAQMVDYVTPDFVNKVKKGLIINNPYNRQETRAFKGGVDWTASRPYQASPLVSGVEYRSHGAINNHAIPSKDTGFDASAMEAMKTEAMTAVLANANSPTFQGLVSGGELKKTLNLVRQPYQGLVKHIKAARRPRRYIGRSGRLTRVSRPGGIPAALRSAFPPSARSLSGFYALAQSSWLTARYGWRPAMFEIESLIEATQRETARLTCRNTRSSTQSGGFNEYGLYLGSASHYFNVDKRTEYSHDLSARAGLIIDYKVGANTYGLSLRDIPGSAWELLPWSFVVDFFFNVGSYVEAIVPSGNVSALASWIVVDRVSKVDTYYDPVGQPFAGATADISGSTTFASVIYRERYRETVLSPGLTYKASSIKSLLSGKDLRLIDLIALFTSLKSGQKYALKHG